MAEIPPQAESPLPSHPDDTRARVLLRMLHGARDRDDRAEAKRAWEQIVLAELERVRGIVVLYRHDSLPGGRIPAADVDDVVQRVFLRLHERVDAFRGRSVGELRNFMRTAANYACLDHVGMVVRDEQRRAGSLDAGADDPQAVSRELLDRLAASYAAADESAELAAAVIHPALAEVDDDKRSVLVMTEAGFTVAEIQERLGISRDAVYQRRRRGLQQLRAAIREQTEDDLER